MNVKRQRVHVAYYAGEDAELVARGAEVSEVRFPRLGYSRFVTNDHVNFNPSEEEDDDMTDAGKTGKQLVEEYNALAVRATALGSDKFKLKTGKFENLVVAQRAVDKVSRAVEELEVAVAATPRPLVTEHVEVAEEPAAEKTEERAVAKKSTNGNGGRTAAGKPAKKVEEFRQVRPGTTRAKVLAAMTQGKTVDQAAKAAGVSRTQLLAHAHCLWRDCGVGYEVDKETKVIAALFPGRRSIEDAIAQASA